MAGLEGKVRKGDEAVADFNVKLNVDKERTEDVAYEKMVCKFVRKILKADWTYLMKASFAFKLRLITSALVQKRIGNK